MTHPEIAVYTPDSALASPAGMLREMFRDLRASRELAWRLAVRDIQAQHRRAFLGVLWDFILPLANTVTWIALSRSGVVSVGATSLPYPVYVFTGTMLWAILMEAVNAPLAQTEAARGMLAKLNFPREALVVSGVYQTLFRAGIKGGVLIAALFWVGIEPGWGLLLFPFGVLSLIGVGTALGVLITPVGMLYSDAGRTLPLLMQFLMYLSPVVLAMPAHGTAALLFRLNPLSPLLLTTRDWLTGAVPEFLGYFLVVNAVTCGVMLAVWIAYRLAMPILIERMSA